MPGLSEEKENEVLNLGIRSYRTIFRRNTREKRCQVGEKKYENNTDLYIPHLASSVSDTTNTTYTSDKTATAALLA